MPDREPAQRNISYGSYWEAMNALDFNAAVSLGHSDDEQVFARSLVDVVAGRFDSVRNVLYRLHESSQDSLIRRRAGDVLKEFLFAESRYSEVLNLKSAAGNIEQDVLARGFSSLPMEETMLPSRPVTLSIELSSTGSPIVEVVINGHKLKFWLDTGAGVTVLSSDIAEQCEAKPVIGETENIGTATSKRIDVLPTSIAELRIGDLTIRNHPSIIIQKNDLEFYLFGFIRIMKIDGIVGWDILRNLDVDIDYANKVLTIRRPAKKEPAQRNLFWFGYPVVTLRTEDGVALNFGFDSGASSSSIHEVIFRRISATMIDSTQRRIGSAGGWETVHSKIIPQLELILGSNLLRFANIPTVPTASAIFGTLDGRLGSDIAKSGVIHLDFTNGEFRIDANQRQEPE